MSLAPWIGFALVAASPFLIPRLRWGTSRAQRVIDGAAYGPITSARDGERSCIRGTVVAHDELLTSPLTETACVYWEVQLAEDAGSDRRERGNRAAACSFLVTDETGCARVIPIRPIVLAPVREIDRSTPIRGPRGPAAARCIGAFGHKLRLAFAQGRLELVERVVVPGMTVKVVGGCTREPDPDAAADVTGYRDQLPTRPVLSGSRRAPLIVRAETAP